MTSEKIADFSVAGAKLNDLINHLLARQYTISGITASDFIKHHGGQAIDLPELQKQFKLHCPDYMEEIGDAPSKALSFCSKIIYEIEPESRKVKKGTGDKTWMFVFVNKNINHAVYVSTSKEDSNDFKATHKPTHMILTLKQAALLAHETFARVVTAALLIDGKQVLLTPLAGACFSRDDVPLLAGDLGESIPDVLNKINQSTQSGGQLLKHGDVDFAICASISATRNLKDENMKKSIVTKTVKQYISCKKVPNKERISIIAKYATGGIPAEYGYDELLKLYDQAQVLPSAIKIRQAIQHSTLQSDIMAPQTLGLPKI